MHNLRSEINQVALRTEGMSGQSRRYLMHATWVGRLGAQVTCAVQVRRWSGKRRTAVWIVTFAKDVAFCILSKPFANADAPTRVAKAAVSLPAWPAKPTHACSWRKANQEVGCREPRRRCAGRRVGGSRSQHTLRRAAEHAERA
jgi:hypothetical protein